VRRLLVGVCMTWASLTALALYPYSSEVLDVSGHWTGAAAEVVWTTRGEAGLAGFRVCRQQSAEDVALNEDWIHVDISRVEGGAYQIVDPAQTLHSEASYRLDGLLLDGSVTSLGVWPVRFEEGQRIMQAKVTGDRAASDTALIAPAAVLSAGTALKVPVAIDDLYAVTFADIAAGLDRSESEVAAMAAEGKLAMRCGQVPVAYGVDADRQRMVFYGWAATSTYTKTNIFWIEPGDGLHILRQSPDAVAVSDDLSFTSRRRMEQDLAVMTERGILRDDLYFWKSIIAGHASRGAHDLEVPLDGYAGGAVTIMVDLIGWNDTPMNPDHLAEIRFNGTLLGSMAFDGKDEASAVFTAAQEDVLSHNILNIKGILQPGHTASFFVIDGFDVEYERVYAPVDELLYANSGGHPRISAARFDDPVVLEVSDPHVPLWVADDGGALPADHSWPAAPDSRWVFREQSAIRTVTPYPGGFGGWMLDASNTVDYLVVAPRAFAVPAERLASYRAGLGLRSAVAIYEDICDQFADGLNSPEAIRDLLIYARDHWSAAPWMVVLGGWGHYDYLGASTTVINPLPPLLATDSVALRPSDLRFADLAGNEIPDLAIGRLPVQSVAHFDDYITKLQTYEALGPQPWQERAVFVADNADGGGNFTATNEEMAEETAKRYGIQQISLDEDPPAIVREALFAAFVNGTGLIHYTGHGSSQRLAEANENLLSVDDVNAMVNPPTPLFMSLTCYIGRFDAITWTSLGETLVLRNGGGSLAVFAPSGLSWNVHSKELGKAFHRYHAEERADAIGPGLLRARQRLGALTGLAAHSMRTYNLLGDPAIKLRGGEAGAPPGWADRFAYWRWERFAYTELADDGVSGPIAHGEGKQWSNLLDYAFGGAFPRLVSGGFCQDTGHFRAAWSQRKAATDLQYRLWMSTDLRADWEPAPPDTEFAFGDLPGDSLERITATIPRDTDNLFLRLEVVHE